MKEKSVRVVCAHGMHLRVAAKVAESLKSLNSNVVLKIGGREARASSILEILLLEAGENDEIQIIAEGTDELAALETLSTVLTDGAGI